MKNIIEVRSSIVGYCYLWSSGMVKGKLWKGFVRIFKMNIAVLYCRLKRGAVIQSVVGFGKGTKQVSRYSDVWKDKVENGVV